MVRFTKYVVLALVVLVAGLMIASQVIKPEYLYDFESDDFYRTSAQRTSPGDTGLLLDFTFEQTLGGDLSGVEALDVHVYPNVLPQIRRYGWYPYREEDRLTVTPTWSADVTSVTVNGEARSAAEPIELFAEDHGQETVIVAATADGARTANYVFLTLPHTFPPLKTTVHSPGDVAPGIITGLQAAPNNPTFSQGKMLRNLLYTQGVFGTLAQLRKARMQPFDDFSAADLASSLDFENREYLPFVNFALDKYGTPLKYNNSDPRTIFLPFTNPNTTEGGLLPEHGFIYKELVLDTDDNFAEAISRSFVAPKGEATRIEIPRHLDQFDDGHHIDITPWGNVQNLFYRIHPAGTELKNGDVLDVNVTSTYLVELDSKGKVIWEWDFNRPLHSRPVDHVPAQGSL